MKITDISEDLRIGKNIELREPSLYRLFEMHSLIAGFTTDHKFLYSLRATDSLEKIAELIISSVRNFENDIGYPFHIIENSTGHMIGCISIGEPRKNLGYYTLGYWLGTDYIGRGYGLEALIMVRDIALKLLKPNRLEIHTASTNTASNIIAKKAGFELEATMRNFCKNKNGDHDRANFYSYPIKS